MYRDNRDTAFTLAFDYGYFDWQSENRFIGFYNASGDLLRVDHIGDNTFRTLDLSQTLEEAWCDIEKNYIESVTYDQNKRMICYLRPFLTTDLIHPKVEVVRVISRENGRYLDIHFTLNHIRPISFCYLIAKDSPHCTRICKLFVHDGNDTPFVFQTTQFFGEHEHRIIREIENHPKVRLKVLL